MSVWLLAPECCLRACVHWGGRRVGVLEGFFWGGGKERGAWEFCDKSKKARPGGGGAFLGKKIQLDTPWDMITYLSDFLCCGFWVG